MMRVVDLELSVIGAQVGLPQGSAFRSGGGDDRLAELASWWAGVAGTAPPRQVRQLWLSSQPVGWSQADVTARAWEGTPDVRTALEQGVATADAAVDDGVDLLLLTVPEDTDWEILVAHLLDLDPVEALGWPTARGLSDVAWMTRVAAVRDGLRRLRGIHNQPELLLSTLGNPSLAAGTGLLLRATSRRTAVFVDGPGAAACALLAHRVARPTRSWLQATDGGADPLHDRVLTELRLHPLTQFRLTPPRGDAASPLPGSDSPAPRPTSADGTSARIALYLLETALARSLVLADEALADSALDPSPAPDEDARG
jgi:phosphoribosyltransferase-like protein